MTKISVLTASIRPEGLEIVKNALYKQSFPWQDFEWIIVGNKLVYDCTDALTVGDIKTKVILERLKREGDFYNIDKAYNDLFKNASGQLAVMWTDMTWAPPDTLTNLWKHYENNPKACVGGVGDQYDPTIIEFGKPQIVLWKDPRKRADYGSFYEINPVDFEMCLASIPIKAVFDVGGFEEDYDKGAAVGEKELCMRMDKLGYKFYLDQSLEYRALKHGRIAGTEEWDKHYNVSCELLKQHLHQINEGVRLQLDYLKCS